MVHYVILFLVAWILVSMIVGLRLGEIFGRLRDDETPETALLFAEAEQARRRNAAAPMAELG